MTNRNNNLNIPNVTNSAYSKFDMEDNFVKTYKAFDDGPIPQSKRKCTDLIWVVIFVIASMIIFSGNIFCFLKGDPRRLGLPHDPDRKAL